MKRFCKFFIAIILPLNVISQTTEHGTGLVFDDEAYMKSQVSARLSKGEYDKLPRSHSLKAYAPTPGNQGSTSTCTAWSTAYHAYTIAESVKLNRTDVQKTNAETFSPSFIYNQIRNYSDCNNGTSIYAALDLMKDIGNMKISSFPFNCYATVTQSQLNSASSYKIYDFKTLFSLGSNQKILPVKKAISENRPVILGMSCCLPSFGKIGTSGIWSPTQAEYNINLTDGHAMTVVGYDDDKNDGSFQLINSWGPEWGDGGFFWITYSDFDTFVAYAYEMILMPPLVVDLNGEVEFKLISGETMAVTFSEAAGMYQMTKPYTSGTQFRFYMNNSQPAYVYALGSDLSNRSFRIFPYNDSISAYLGYKSNKVAIPDEDHYVFLDNNVGKDYFCILYSKFKIDIPELLAKLEMVQGDFPARINTVLSGKLIDASRITYKKDAISFEAKSGEQSIVPIIIEFTHN